MSQPHEALSKRWRELWHLESPSFSQPTEGLLRENGYSIFTLTGMDFELPEATIEGPEEFSDLGGSLGRRTVAMFPPSTIRSRNTQVAINFNLCRNRWSTAQYYPWMKEQMRQLKRQLRRQDKGLKAIIGNPADYLELNQNDGIILRALQELDGKSILTSLITSDYVFTLNKSQLHQGTLITGVQGWTEPNQGTFDEPHLFPLVVPVG
jgi:hypothetical protein